ncbi:hypothetical protein LEP1GSC083_1673 [Leptospira interrogans serovar Pyrogenes str. L0374]|uniref:Uncharacterized protein n=1 Tax=Leptospira interrogans serovar Pyrogenes str. L0374 TaxID=1049928 RepID=M6K6X5_LEPIR|nr:hypothetical protein LEP1GSC077_1737 [Leptospira interrogans str. C10069]EMN29929.1 hypothetical protein LEP1GSC083_1673 [Leptospira interrogans serovar Pyrogenes str. L0374]EMN64022.1 hypothetical protein LEP1GSC092_0743 [Leptospira interrogans serovar Pyrogenes str. R168]
MACGFCKKSENTFWKGAIYGSFKNLVEIADTNGWKNTFIVLNFLLIFQRL